MMSGIAFRVSGSSFSKEVNMGKMCFQVKRLKENGIDSDIDVSDEDFLKQVLAKPPKGKDEELRPHQVAKW